MADAYNLEFFNVTFPAEYVAHVEINRPEKMNAFKEVYVPLSFYSHLSLRTYTISRYTPKSSESRPLLLTERRILPNNTIPTTKTISTMLQRETPLPH